MSTELINFILGALLNLGLALVIVRGIYYPVTQDKRYVFTFLAFNTVIYFVLRLLTTADISVGVGFGLFAIFSVLRYRADEMPIREMTYLFIVIALPVMNSVLIADADYLKLVLANGLIALVLLTLEREWGFHFESTKKISYEKIDLITPDKTDLLLADLRERTGLPISRVSIGRIDFLRDSAELVIYYDEPNLRRPSKQPRSAPTVIEQLRG